MSTDTVQDGVVVSMEYSLKVNDEVLDTSEENGLLQFLVGYAGVPLGLESEMIGMTVGDKKDVVVAPKNGFGEFNDEDFVDMPRSEFPVDIKIDEGVELQFTDDDGNYRVAFVESFDDEFVHLDFNHPLAGATLYFTVKVISLREPTSEELEHGHVHENGGHHH